MPSRAIIIAFSRSICSLTVPLGSCFLIHLSSRSAALMNVLAILGGNSVISSGGMYSGARGCPRGCLCGCPRGCLCGCPRGCLCGCPRGCLCGCPRGCLCGASSGGLYGGGRGASHETSSGGIYGGGRGGSHDNTRNGTHDGAHGGTRGKPRGPNFHREASNRGHMSVFLSLPSTSLTGLVSSLLHDISQNVRE